MSMPMVTFEAEDGRTLSANSLKDLEQWPLKSSSANMHIVLYCEQKPDIYCVKTLKS